MARVRSGDPVVATYFPTDGNWALLDLGSIIDRFYTFQTDGHSILPSSCYYQINPPGSSNFSQCFALTGVKTSVATNSRAQEAIGSRLDGDEARVREHERINTESDATPVPPEIIERYLQMRGN